MSINVVAKIDDLVTVKHVLASVFDKTGLEKFIPELLKINPEIKIFSTGGTYKKIKEISVFSQFLEIYNLPAGFRSDNKNRIAF